MSKRYSAKEFVGVLSYVLPKIPSQASLFVATKIETQVQADFDAGVNPYGRPWRPLAKATLAKGRHPPPLTDTYKGRAGVRVNPLPSAGVEITSRVAYMGIHQAGSDRIPRRQFVPTVSQGLPKRYRDLYEVEIKRWTDRIG